MKRSATRLLWGLVGWVAMAASVPACTEEPAAPEELDPPDFYLTIKLATNFRPQAVDQLEVVVRDALMILEESSGEYADGGITWETRDGTSGSEFSIVLTGEYFQANAMEVSRDTYELDIPFIIPESWHGSSPADAAFSVQAAAFWADADGELQQIGRGTGQLPMPLTGPYPTTVEVVCDAAWAWTCRTGCADSSDQCADIEDCGSGSWNCVDECCEAAD
jgi:hypothetical protein